MNTEEYISHYLFENVEASETLHQMRGVISEFAERAPKILVTKCIDGRVHGSKAKGYPATTIRFGRTDGNIVSTSKTNFWFWNRIDNVINNAKCNTPEMPAMFIAYMHRSDKGLGCAAHNNDEDKSYQAIHEQTTAIKRIFSESDLYVLEGITNTDDMSETLIFPNGVRLSTTELIQNEGLKELPDLFQESYLERQILDPATARNVSFQLPKDLVSGLSPRFHSDFQTSLSMKAHLLCEISRIIREENHKNQTFIHPQLFQVALSKLREAKVPNSMLAPLMYQSIWNVSYALFQSKRLKALPEQEQ